MNGKQAKMLRKLGMRTKAQKRKFKRLNRNQKAEVSFAGAMKGSLDLHDQAAREGLSEFEALIDAPDVARVRFLVERGLAHLR